MKINFSGLFFEVYRDLLSDCFGHFWEDFGKIVGKDLFEDFGNDYGKYLSKHLEIFFVKII